MSQLILTSAPSSGIVRIFGRTHAPFSPAPWPKTTHPNEPIRSFRNRFDDIFPDLGYPVDECFRTIYGATTLQTAFGELLAGLRPPTFDAGQEVPGVNNVDPVWEVRAGIVPATWRFRRQSAVARFPLRAKFIDLRHAGTIAHLRSTFVPFMNAHYPDVIPSDDFDLSDAMSRNRRLTQHLARYLHDLPNSEIDELGEGEFIAGIRYPSRHSADWDCWAIFADRLGNGLVVDLPKEIDVDDPDLQVVAATFNLAIE